LWSTDEVKEVDFNKEQTNLKAKNVAVELSEDGTSYTIKSTINPKSIVKIKVTRTAPGFVVGKDGKTSYGTDPKAPWGYMRHAFWPRNTCEGYIMTKDGPIDFKGKAMFSFAMQGMKPHHAAGKWNFCNFQGPTYSAIMMEFITPPSYGSTLVNVGGIAKDGEIVTAGSSNTVAHTEIQKDSENDWPEPSAIKFTWGGNSKDGKPVEAVLEGSLGTKLDRIDLMAVVPSFVKAIAESASGTKPYIYQYSPQTPLTLKVKIGDEEHSEEGILFSEATFISE